MWRMCQYIGGDCAFTTTTTIALASNVRERSSVIVREVNAALRITTQYYNPTPSDRFPSPISSGIVQSSTYTSTKTERHW